MPDEPRRVLVVRLSAMGDIVHTLPAVATLRKSWPNARIVWAVATKWMPLVEGPVIGVDRRSIAGVASAWRQLRVERFDLAIDFQGLIQSALVARASGAPRVLGYASPRERAATVFYHKTFAAPASHIVEQHLGLAAAAGASRRTIEFSLPRGTPEGDLPPGDFVLASPLAGWTSKQWPLENWTELARRIAPMPLVVNGPPGFPEIAGAWRHESGIGGLIDATRRARAVVGVDSGPLHLAAALAKPGVAIFGPTDPARNGPYGDSMTVLRATGAATSYERRAEIDPSMWAIAPADVERALSIV